MSRETVRKYGYIAFAVGAVIFIAGLACSPWLAIVGAILAVGAIPFALSLGISAPLAVQQERERMHHRSSGSKTLAIGRREYGGMIHPLFLFLIFILFGSLGCFLMFAAFYEQETVLRVVFGIISLVFIWLVLFMYQATKAKISIDRHGIYREAPARKPIEMKWGDLLRLEERAFRSGTIYEVFSIDSSLSFGSNLPNIQQLLTCVSAALDAAPDSHDIPVRLPSTVRGGHSAIGLYLFGAIALLVGALFEAVSLADFDKVNKAVTPISEIAKLNVGTIVKVEGKLSAANPLLSRDGKESFGFEQIECQKYVGAGNRGDRSSQYWAPLTVSLEDGNAKINVKTNEIYQLFVQTRCTFKAEQHWVDDPKANLVATIFDDDISKFMNRYGGACNVRVWALPNGSPATIVGVVKEIDGEKCVTSVNDILWMSTKSQAEMSKTMYGDLLIGAIILLLGFVFIVAGILDKKVIVDDAQ